MDWLDLLAVQGTLKSLLQHHSSKASVLWRSAFFTVQPSHPYMTTGKTIALTRWTLVGKVISLLLNIHLLFKLESMSPNCNPNILSTAVLSGYHSNTSSENCDFFQKRVTVTSTKANLHTLTIIIFFCKKLPWSSA